MSDTKISIRQKAILEALQMEGGLSRSTLERVVARNGKISRITILRDLADLIDLGLVDVEGRGRATLYQIRHAHPLLGYVDLQAYFEKELSDRLAFKGFRTNVLSQMHKLFTPDEQEIWKKSSLEYRRRIRKLEPTIMKRELERFIIEFSWKSSQIEGNTYDLLETEILIKQRVQAKGHTQEEAMMILNHKGAFDAILKDVKRFQRLTYSTVTQLHNVLVQGLDVSTGIRRQQVRITGTMYVPPQDQEKLRDLLRKMIDQINQSSFVPEKALIALAVIPYLQPFADGNKRTARMLANAILLAHDYFPLSYRTVDPNEYIKAVLLFYEQNNLYHLKRLFIQQMLFAKEHYFLF